MVLYCICLSQQRNIIRKQNSFSYITHNSRVDFMRDLLRFGKDVKKYLTME